MASLLRSALSANSEEFEQTKEKVSAEQLRRQERIEQTNDMVERSVRTYMKAAAAPSGEFGEIVERPGFLILRSTAKIVTLLLTTLLIFQGVALLAVLLDGTRFTRSLARYVFMAVGLLQVVLLIVSAHNFLVSLKDQRVHRKFMRFGIGKTVASEISDQRNANKISAQGEDGKAKQLSDFVRELTERMAQETKDTSQLFSLPRADKLEDDTRRFRNRQAGLFFASLTGAAAAGLAAAMQLAPEKEVEPPSADAMKKAVEEAGREAVRAADQRKGAAPMKRIENALLALASPSEQQTAALRAVQNILLAFQVAENALVTARASTTATKDAQRALVEARESIAGAAATYRGLNQTTEIDPKPVQTTPPPPPPRTIRASITAEEEAALQALFAMEDLKKAIATSNAEVPETDHSLRGAALATAAAGGVLSLLSVITSAVLTNKYYGRAYLDLPKFYNQANLFLLGNLDSVKASLLDRIRLAELFQLTDERQRLEELAKSVSGGIGGLESVLATQAIAAAAAPQPLAYAAAPGLAAYPAPPLPYAPMPGQYVV